MTTYPGTRVRPGPVHLSPGQVTTGQPVTVSSLDKNGVETEFPAVYVRAEGRYMRCLRQGETTTGLYLPRRVFPRWVAYRRWVVALQGSDTGELRTVAVMARGELEARYNALTKIRSQHGPQANQGYVLHSVNQEG